MRDGLQSVLQIFFFKVRWDETSKEFARLEVDSLFQYQVSL